MGLNPACSMWSHTSDSNVGVPVAALSGAWPCRVSAGTGLLVASVL